MLDSASMVQTHEYCLGRAHSFKAVSYVGERQLKLARSLCCWMFSLLRNISKQDLKRSSVAKDSSQTNSVETELKRQSDLVDFVMVFWVYLVNVVFMVLEE